jgi:F-type H+-transporting ATPase subunit b
VIHTLATFVIPFASGTGAEEESGNFLVMPSVGMMIWVLLTFGLTFIVLKVAKGFGFGRITEAIERRQNLIAESIKYAEDSRKEADDLLADYRQRLSEARIQADEIIARARTAADQREADAQKQAAVEREELLKQTRNEIQLETQKALQDLRREVASLTVEATERVTKKTLTGDDQKRLVEEALSEVDFSALSGNASNN